MCISNEKLSLSPSSAGAAALLKSVCVCGFDHFVHLINMKAGILIY
jgi:hypothetical protein